MKVLSTIQEHLDANAKAEAEKEFDAAKSKCEELLKPFFITSNPNSEQRKAIREFFVAHTGYTNWNTFRIGQEMPCPEPYVIQKQTEASEAFMKRVAALEDQYEELRSQIEE